MNNISFKAMIVTETDDKQFTREIKEKSIADLPEGEVLIKVYYSSLNYKDALSASGNKGVTRKYPHTPGVDAAGVIVESSDSTFKPGDEVLVTGYDLGMNTSGGYEEYIRVPANWVVRLPENLSLRESMIYGTAGFTAALSCYKLINNGVTPDMGPVLVTGATGGVGSIAVSILVKSGYEVVAVNGIKDEKDYLLELGAKEVISIEEADDKSGRPLLKPRWAGAIDTVAGNILSTAIKTTKYGGSVTCCGNVGSAELESSIYPFILNGVSLLGIDSVNCPVDTRIAVWNKIASDWKLEYLDKITTELPDLEALDERIDLILQGKNRGRAIVKVSK
ncbi:YhdH/YhfP family quinone oxidoreductase [Desulfobulbus rhabdoformis]|uniref:YhdH/YhfP family quinone oxidoreductase n=1 Tax=Desulfobulbus rhabdoformis TaxID=34032 RepID=UPI001962C558|nr:YhdH/YhfP family quinone oxidoreductase [Desulfobulbus rhabdoformis]MBM9614372.1 YhdH/YhfP family quinone oxidoreductase [Desulfobulbus rhabdoformis]